MTGTLVEKFATQEVTASFKKREFVVEQKENSGGREFIELLKFQLTQDRCDLIESYQINSQVKISFNIKGRKWEKDGRISYFINLEAWRIENVNSDQNAPPPPTMDEIPPEMENDLPF